MKTQKFNEALKCFEDALILNKEIEDKGGEIHSLGNIGSIFIEKEEYDKAIRYLYEALEIAEKTHQKFMSKLTKNIAIVFFKEENYEKGFRFLAKSFSTSQNSYIPKLMEVLSGTILNLKLKNDWNSLSKIHIMYNSDIKQDEFLTNMLKLIHNYAQYRNEGTEEHQKNYKNQLKKVIPAFRELFSLVFNEET